MAIIKMKKLSLLGMQDDRDDMLKQLQLLGCVHIIENPEVTGASRLSADTTYQVISGRLKHAVALLDKYAPVKVPMFSDLPLVSQSDLFDPTLQERVECVLDQIYAAESKLSASQSDLAKLEVTRLMYVPWESLDVPLSTSETAHTQVQFGMIPTAKNADDLAEKFSGIAEGAYVLRVSADTNQQYLFVVNHKDANEQVTPILREFMFNRTYFRDVHRSARDTIREIDVQIAEKKVEIDAALAELRSYADYRSDLKLYYDQIGQSIATEEAKNSIYATEKVFGLTGWVPMPEQTKVEELLNGFTCSYELTDPAEGDNVPIKFRNNRVTQPLNMVTEMYTLPVYSNIDPNPLLAIFFPMFFGMMFADIGYGLLILLAGWLIIRKAPRLRGGFGEMARLSKACGIWTVIWGAISGGFFGDLIPTIQTLAGVENPWDLPRLLDPTSDPITVMVVSLVLGAVHLLTGMAVKFYILCRDGQKKEAILTILPWWCIFIGIALLATGITPWLAILSAVFIVVAPAILHKSAKKIGAGLASLYDITSYFSDLMSYIRLMALMMAGGVIAMVVNKLGAMPATGNLIMLPAFILIFLFGHGFNIGLNIIGTFIHDARLQYLEFYGKFFEEGGKPFRPLSIKTKYVDIVD